MCTATLRTAAAAYEAWIKVMNDSTVTLDQAEQEMLIQSVLAQDVADDALEAASETRKGKGGNFTLAFCSGLSTCPT
jgi:hypothetical protein